MMKKVFFVKPFLFLLTLALFFQSCKENKKEEQSPESEKESLTQEQFLQNKLHEYLEENPDFPGFYSNGDGFITEIRVEGEKVYQIEYKSINGEYPEQEKYEVSMYPSYGDPNKWEPVFYNSSGTLYNIYVNVNRRYDTLQDAIMANYEHDYGPGVKIKSVTATSVLEEKYSAENLIDGTYKSWVEGEEGSGIGTKITFEFERPYHFADYTNYACINIVNGFGDLKYFHQNNRVKEMNLWIDDDPVPVKITLYDVHVGQTLVLREYIGNRYVKKLSFEILSVYPGTKYDDTCIAEIYIGPFNEDDRIPLDPYYAELIYAYYRDFVNDTKNFRFKNGNLEWFYDVGHDPLMDWVQLTLIPSRSFSLIEFDFDGDTPIIIRPGAVQNQDDIDANRYEGGYESYSCKPLYKDYKLYAYKNGGWKEYANSELTALIDKTLADHKGEYFDFDINNRFSRLNSDVNDGENINYSIKNPTQQKCISFDFYKEKCLLYEFEKNEGIDCGTGKAYFYYDGKKYVLE